MHTAVDDRHQGDESSQGDWGGGEVALCRGSQSFTESPQPAAGAGRVRPEEAAGRGCAQELENVAVIWAAQTPAGSLTSLLSPRDVHIICLPSSWSASTSPPCQRSECPREPSLFLSAPPCLSLSMDCLPSAVSKEGSRWGLQLPNSDSSPFDKGSKY